MEILFLCDYNEKSSVAKLFLLKYSSNLSFANIKTELYIKMTCNKHHSDVQALFTSAGKEHTQKHKSENDPSARHHDFHLMGHFVRL